MPHIKLKADTLDRAVERFAPAPLTAPIFVNSIPKSGTHLLKNILRMFVPLAQHYRVQFIQWGNLQEHLVAFDPGRNLFSYGHLFFSDASAIELAGVRKVLLYRDPYDWVLARARFFLSDEFDGNVDYLKEGKLTVDELLSLMIFGIHTKTPKLADMYDLNVAAWLGAGNVHAVRYEDLVGQVRDLDSDAAAQFFAELFSAAGISPVPDNWRQRVAIGADRKHSGTARENLTGIGLEVPNTLPDRHKRLVDYAAPGLRQLLGYA
ncbi:MAG: hypothetical protein V4502_08995 [Pseudomonadota bacterium]